MFVVAGLLAACRERGRTGKALAISKAKVNSDLGEGRAYYYTLGHSSELIAALFVSRK